jgi:hypothetical protein
VTQIALGEYLKVIAKGVGIVLLPAALYFFLVRHLVEPDYFRIVFLSSGLGIVFLLVLRFGDFRKLPKRSAKPSDAS